MATTDAPLDERESERDIDVHRTTQPALDVFQVGKLELLYDGAAGRSPPITPWADGFDSEREVIDWWQAATVRSFGLLATHCPPRNIRRDRTFRKALLNESDDAAAYRARFRRQFLEPALFDAWNHLARSATEQLGRNEDSVDYRHFDARDEKHVGRMPALTQLDRAQSAVLRTLWRGFEDATALDRWLSTLPAATRAQHEKNLPKRVMSDRTTRRLLLGTSEDAAAHRRRFAIVVLLPAFARAANTLRGGEESEDINGFSGAGEIA